MARGQADFGAYASLSTIGAVSDMAELAVRLGSISIFDRRGKVIDEDDFESGLKGWSTLVAGGGTVYRASTAPKSGSQHFVMSAVGAGVCFAQLMRHFPRFASKRLGIEFAFSAPDTGTYIELILSQYDGTNEHTAWIRVDVNASVLQYLDQAGAFQTFATIDPLRIINTVYYPLKVVGDWTDNTYARCVYAGQTYDLSAYNMYEAVNATNPITVPAMRATLRAGAGGVCFADDYILTMEEP